MNQKYIRKSIALILVAVLISIFSFSSVSADTGLIHQSSTIQTITSGATLENIVRFTRDGWLNINVVRVDLFNPNINVDTISNAESVVKLTSTKNLAASRGAVAAINSGFFMWAKEPGIGYPVGDSIESGKVTSISPDFDLNQNKDRFNTLSISTLNQVIYDYWKTDISIIAPTGVSTPIGRYNKLFSGHRDFTILDRRWSNQTVGNVNSSKDLVEMIVDNGQVVEIRQSQPATQIPVNGYVVVTRQLGGGGQLLLDNFKVGDPVTLSIKTTPDWTTLKTAVTGGAMLVKDGVIPQTFSHIPEGTRSTRNPRSAVGSTKDGKQLILVTVDGRLSGGSIGMTLTELAQLMQELGATNAMNLDGGGSTTMVARNSNSQTLEVVNNPSDGAGRKISSALGIFSIAPPSALDGITINTEDDNIFVNTSRAFTVKGFDRYYNPIDIDPAKIKWSVSGIKGKIIDSVFYPTSVGSGIVKATYDNVTATLEVSSLSSPVKLLLDTSSINIPSGGTKTFSVVGKNKNGYYGNISPEDVKWVVKGKLGNFDKGTFISDTPGTGYIDASVGATHAYCSVSVELESKTVLDTFESVKGLFTSYPTTVEGSFALSTEQKHSGELSGKLSYKFTDIEGTRAAYIDYPDGGLNINPDTSKIGLWVYNSVANSNWMATTVIDGNGSPRSLYFTKTMDWVGWKYLEASTANISSPSSLTRIYIVQPNPITDEGSIYVDDLSFSTSTYQKIDAAKIPKDTVPLDEAKKAVTFKSNSTSIRFSVFGQNTNPLNAVGKSLFTKLNTRLKTNYDAVTFVGKSSTNAAKAFKKPALSTNFGYKSFDLKGNKFIQLDISKNSLRLTDPNQWTWFLNELDSAKSNNVFIFLASPPSSFSDSKEGPLFRNILTEYKKKTKKNVWVFYNGSENTSSMEKGIKYISTAGFNVEGLTSKNTSPAKFVLVTVKGSVVTYEFKSIV
jgi:exopolysaccharide biosynthesis protein